MFDDESALRLAWSHELSLPGLHAGSALPVLLIFSMTDNPVWVSLNSEGIVEELVRTIVGSASLVLAVPITTFLAAWYFSKTKVKV